MKKLLLSVTTVFLFILSLVNSPVSLQAADVPAKEVPEIEHQNESTVHDAKYAFSLRAGSETKIRFWQNTGGTERNYQGKIVLSENADAVSPAIHPDSTLSGKVGVYITNAGLYEGKQISVKITYYWNNISHKGISMTPVIHPYYNRATGQISHYYANMSYEAKWELLYNGKPIKVNMSATLGDVEGNETCGMKINDGRIRSLACYYNDRDTGDIYNCNVNYVKSGDWHYIYGDGESVCNDKLSGSLRFELDNVSSFSQRYVLYYDIYNYTEAGKRAVLPTGAGWDGLVEHNKQKCDVFDRAVNTITSQYVSGGTCYACANPAVDGSNIAYGWYFYDATPIGSYDIPNPSKGLEQLTNTYPLTYSYDVTEDYVTSIGNERAPTHTFAIMQYVPPINTEYAEGHYYKSFTITDTLPENENAKAEYVSANVLDMNRNDVSNQFVITENNGTVTATAKEEYLNQTGFYNNTYILRIGFQFIWKNQITVSEELVNTAQAAVTPYHALKAEIRDSNDVTVKAVRKKLIIKKQWNDADDADGLRPENIVATLLADYYVSGTPVVKDIVSGVVVLSEANDWTGFVWINDPDYTSAVSYSSGIYQYHWKELSVPEGYVSSVETENHITTITNTHTPETITLTLKKQWNDDNNADGLQKDSVNVTLFADKEKADTYAITKENGWQLTVEHLNKNKKGKPINYTWQEESIAGYTPVFDYNAYDAVLTNIHQAERIHLKVRQEWDDYDNADGIRPESVTAVLYADGKPVKDQDGNPITVNLADKDGWNDTVLDVLKNKDGRPIEYSFVQEPVPDGYTTEYSMDGDTFVITSVHEPERVTLTIEKQWNDYDDADGLRPEKINVTLSVDNEKADTYVLSAENKWKVTVRNLIKNKKGTPIDYIWQEESIPEGYSASYKTEGYQTVITNTHIHDLTSTTLKKVFDDADNADGIRPGSIDFRLNADGEEIGTYTLSEKNNWEITVNDLDMNKAGKKISYTWEEINVPEGYISEKNIKGSLTEITNTHSQETVDFHVRLQFEDDHNRDGIRPDEVTVGLIADGEEIGTYTLSEENNSADVKGLPKNRNGKPITYDFVQKGTPNQYDIQYETAEKMVVITDIHTPEKVTASVKKVWDDHENASDLRPESIQAALLINGVKSSQTVTLSEDNNWEASIPDLYRYENGTEVVYTFGEVNVPEGYNAKTERTGLSTMITNTLQETETEETIPESTTRTPESTTKAPKRTTKAQETASPADTGKQKLGNTSMTSPKTGDDFDNRFSPLLNIVSKLMAPLWGIISVMIALLLYISLKKRNHE